MKAYLPIVVLAALAGASVTAQAAGDVAAGKAKSVVCAACHGADGNSTNAQYPKLAGQHASYIKKELMDFKAGKKRSNPIMAGMVAALSEKDMDNLAAYFAAQAPSGGYASKAQVALGQKIYRGGDAETGVPACAGCHGPTGLGNPPGVIPRLAGQHPKYVETQLEAFKAGTRSNDPKGMMRDTVRWMTKAEIAAVSQYVSGLH